jgi:hypothetical protein
MSAAGEHTYKHQKRQLLQPSFSASRRLACIRCKCSLTNTALRCGVLRCAA